MITASSKYTFSNIVADDTFELKLADKINTVSFNNKGENDILINGEYLLKAKDILTLGGRIDVIVIDTFLIAFVGVGEKKLTITCEEFENI